MKHGQALVHNVLPGSIAEEAGVEQGDSIISINSEKIKDIFDYRFLIADDNLILEVQKEDGEIWEIEIEKDEYEDLGIEFEHSMIDEAKSCTNKCIFCFIDQLPKGMRNTLYFKDDDSRLSFLTGNYVTLTNVGYEDIDRVIKYRMSPINVSVHTTNPELRVFMLNNKFAGDVMEKIKKLVDGGITVNCQIVLCRAVNDGKELDKSISQLAHLYPGVNSISVVPIGITRHRHGLTDLKPYDKESSRIVVSQVEEWQNQFNEKCGSRVVYLADEFYIMGELSIPGYELYEDFPQIENGVGLIAMFKHEFDEYLNELDCLDLDIEQIAQRTVSIATGISVYKYIQQMATILEEKYNVKVNVYGINNTFFGEHVTVTGLLTGTDIACQLMGKSLGEELLISKSMLKSGENIFLDDITVEMLEEKLNTKISIVDNCGKNFVDNILGKKQYNTNNKCS